MGLLSFFKRQDGAAPAATGADAAHVVDAARTRARRRLIGAIVLLGIGVIAFPLLFETQPRPIPVDIPIEIPRKEGAPPLAVPPPRTMAPAAKPAPAAPVITESKSEAGKEIAAPTEPAPKAVSTPKVEPAPKVVSAPKVEPAAKVVPAPKAEPAPKVVPAPKAEPAPKVAERKPQAPAKVEAAPAAASTAGRFVVQVGAFADVGMAREARAKVERLGLHTYTQEVDTDSGKRTRVRLGPFDSRDEADQAAAKVKAAGLPAAVLAL
jgi:DedD protein